MWRLRLLLHGEILFSEWYMDFDAADKFLSNLFEGHKIQWIVRRSNTLSGFSLENDNVMIQLYWFPKSVALGLIGREDLE